MALIVLKFGGTSLANTKLMNNAVAKVAEEVALGNKVIVVVSAMAGFTDHLVGLTNEITNCYNLDNSLEYANVITAGEQIAAGLFTLLLQQEGLKSRSWLGWQAGIITDDDVVDSNIIELQCDKIIESFEEYQVAVIAGFQGITKTNRVSTLGRGGSDTTAIILAGALNASRCDIYTDVEGVFTADPRIVAKAQKLNSINYDEMVAFAHAGAKVLQAKSAQWAKHYQVNLRVLSSFTSNPGTVVDNSKPHFITGIALSKGLSLDMAKISIIGSNIDDVDLLKSCEDILQKNSINTFTIQNDTMSVSFTIKDEDKFNAIICLHTACKLDDYKIEDK